MVVALIQLNIERLLAASGLDEGNLKILICTLLSFPFSWVFKRLPDKNYTLKNVYNILVSTFYIFGILNLTGGLVDLLFSSLGCYFITRYVKSSNMPWINFIFLMSHLLYKHIQMQFFNEYDATKIDITGALMVLVMKLSAFGWSIHDGLQKPHEINDYNKSRKIDSHPNLLPYLGYVFFYASFLTGPAFDYADYDRFIHTHLFDDVPEFKKGKRVIPKSGKEAFLKTLQGFFWAGVFINIDKYISVNFMLSKEFIKNHGFIYHIFYYWALGFSYRVKYYSVWSIAEGSCILIGIGYNGYDENTKKFKWNRLQNIDPWKFETGQNVHICLEAWNMNTNKWLKNYIYLRVAKVGKGPGFKSTLLTFATSAVWHGTRPGYYLTFVSGAFLQSCGKIFRRNFRPIFIKDNGQPKSTKFIYDIICYFVTQFAFGQAVQPFVLLDFKTSLYCWSICYFFLHIGMAITLFLFKGPYGKIITGALKKFHPKKLEKVTVTPPTGTKLSNLESKLVQDTIKKISYSKESDFSTLGLPSVDILEKVDSSELDEEIKYYKFAWDSFKARTLVKDVEETFKNFTDEVEEIFHAHNTDANKEA